MKMPPSSLLLLATCICASGLTHSHVVRFGPKDCVHVAKSSTGSCVISTRCSGLDTSHTEFAFNCVKKHGIAQRHSFGTGGFEPNEEFDSEIKCHRCKLALPMGGKVTHPANHAHPAWQAALPGKQHTRKHVPTAGNFQHDVPSMIPAPPHRVFKAELQHVDKLTGTPAGLKAHQIRLRANRQGPKSEKTEAAKEPEHLDGEKKLADKKALEEPEHKHEHDVVEPEHKHEHDVVEPEHKHKHEHKSVEPEHKHDVVKYGPESCVSTYRNGEGNCVVQTMCTGVNTSDYEFSVICIGEAGVPVRHLFGKDSFGQTEKFDTLIKCQKCLSPDKRSSFAFHAPAEGQSEEGKIADLSQHVEYLTKIVSNISVNVEKLNKAVFESKPAFPVAKPPAPAAPAAAPAAATKAKVNLLHRAEKRPEHKQAAYIQSKRNRHDDDNEDSDDDDSDDRYEDEEDAATSDKDEQISNRESEVDDDNEFDGAAENQEESEDVHRSSEKRSEDEDKDGGNDSDAASQNQEEEDASHSETAISMGDSQSVEASGHAQASTQKSEDDDVDDDQDSQESDVQATQVVGPTMSTEMNKQVTTKESEDDDEDDDGFA